MKAGAPPSGAAPCFPLLSPADIEALPDLEWLVEGVLPKNALAILYGEPGCGKSFVALSMALANASDRPWLGRTTRQTETLYIAAEGVLGLRNRLLAYGQVYGFSSNAIRFLPSPIQIMDPKQIGALHDLKQHNFSPGLIIVDTLSRVAVGADENSAKDMSQVVAGFDDLKRRLDATMLVIHHTVKQGGYERGSSVLRGAADVMIACEKKEALTSQQGLWLSCAKMRDDEPFKTIGVRLEKVDLPNGKSSLVLGSTFDLQAAHNSHPDKIVEILQTKFADKGATHGELKKAFADTGAGSESSFNRAFKVLKTTSRIRIVESGGKTLYYPPEVNPKSAA
jgi:hypothetical protein